MPAGKTSLAGGLIIVLPAAAFMGGRAMYGVEARWMIAGSAVAQVGTLVWLCGRRWAFRYRAGLVASLAALGAATALLSEVSLRSVGMAVSGICHAAAYASLLGWFLLSLRVDREPVVTGFARRIRREMPARVIRYTRQVTIGWCVFFALQLGASLGLLLLAPATIWYGFITVANLPLIAAMGLAEFVCRMILFRRDMRTGLVATILSVQRGRFSSASRS